MLWYLLSMIYALILFRLIWQLKGNYCIIYIISTLIFAMSAIFDYYSNIANAGFVIRGIRFLFGENTRLFISPFYLSIGMIIGRTKKMTFKISLGTGITLIVIGFLVKISKNNAGGVGTLNLVWQCVRQVYFYLQVCQKLKVRKIRMCIN